MDREKNLAAWHEGSHFATKNRDGSPRVYYHGSNQKLNIIEPNRRDPGAWFTTNLQGAANYARGEDAHVHEVYLKSKNPMVVPFNYDESGNLHAFHNDKKLPFSDNVSIVKHAQKLGYDGVHFPNGNFSEDDNTFVVFHPHQIKSATDNNGNFDPNDPDITKGDGGEVDGITAYHGSPYKFDKFNLNNSGSGFNAYGHGLYFTGDENTARNYKEEVALTTKKPLSQEAYQFLDEHIDSNTKPEDWLQAAINNAKKYSPHLLSEYENLNPKDLGMTTGHMYEVKIKAHPDHFLDYDENISKQSPHIKKSLQMLADFDLKNGGKLNNILEKSNEHDGGSIIDYLEQKYGGKEASKLLYQHGIKGTKYFDGGKQPWMDDSYRNYVVFDHNLVKIKRRYERGGSVEEGITAYHGSPHEFEKFDTSKIGTGEGAQAFGHGLYFAEAEPVAKEYRDALQNPTISVKGKEFPLASQAANEIYPYEDLSYPENINWSEVLYPIHHALTKMQNYDMGLDEAVDDMRSNYSHYKPEYIKKAEQLIRSVKPEIKNKGHMYEVHIDAHPDHFLDWDKPLSEQSEHVKNALANHTPLQKNRPYKPEDTGRDVYYKNTRGLGGKDIASNELMSLGIHGIKYLDQGSRGPLASWSTDKLTHNYVVFDHDRVNIKRRYAEGGEVEGYAKGGDTAIHKGRKFWSGVFDAHDGFIREVHPYKRAEASDFHHSYYVSPQSQDAMKQGDAGFFWVDPDGSINTHWRDDEAPKHIVDAIKSQIEPINKKDGGEVEAYEDGGTAKARGHIIAATKGDAFNQQTHYFMDTHSGLKRIQPAQGSGGINLYQEHEDKSFHDPEKIKNEYHSFSLVHPDVKFGEKLHTPIQALALPEGAKLRLPSGKTMTKTANDKFRYPDDDKDYEYFHFAKGRHAPVWEGNENENTWHEPQHFEEGGVVEPTNTVKAYKLFRTDPRKPNQIFPLFVDANKPVPMGQWVSAEAGPPGKNPTKVKSKLGDLAYRPGWHAGDLPIATHIGGKSKKSLKAPDYRPDNHVWAEIEMPDDVDWQSIANSRARITKAGKPDLKTAHITDQVPHGGHYRYKTNPNMTGNWLIGGEMKVNRILGDDEVKAINDAHGVADLPRLPKAEGGRIGYGFGGDTEFSGSKPERGATGSAGSSGASNGSSNQQENTNTTSDQNGHDNSQQTQHSYRDMPPDLLQSQLNLNAKNFAVIDAMKEENAKDKQRKEEQLTAWANAGFPAGGPQLMALGEETRPTAYTMADISKKSPAMQSQANIIASLAPPPQHYESSFAGNQIAAAPIPQRFEPTIAQNQIAAAPMLQHYEPTFAQNQIAPAPMPQHYESTFAQNQIEPALQQIAFTQPAHPITQTPINKPMQLASLDSSTFKPASPMPDFQPQQPQGGGSRRRLVKKLMPDGTYQDVWEEYAHGGVAKYRAPYHNPAIVEHALAKISAPPPALDPLAIMVAKRGRPF